MNVQFISKIFLREFRSRCRSVNPGVQRRLDILKEGHPDTETLQIDEHEFEKYESNFFEAAKMHKQHEIESKALKKHVDFKQIGRKYFKPHRTPNFLTWSEKEQIRFLSSSDPGTWTPEKLALSFPATVDVIKMVLKSQWKPMGEKRIAVHDKKVANNWKALGREEIDLSPVLKEHISGFVSRSERPSVSKTTGQELPVPTENHLQASSEFANIIKSYKNRYKQEGSTSDEMDMLPCKKSETYHDSNTAPDKLSILQKNKYYTLQALKNEIKSIATNLQGDLITDKKVKPGMVKEVIPESKIHCDDMRGLDRFGEHNKVMRKSFEDNDEILQSIAIPKDKRNTGCVFRVKDCYYDDQGEFLYKVPGMTRN